MIGVRGGRCQTSGASLTGAVPHALHIGVGERSHELPPDFTAQGTSSIGDP